MRAAPLCAVLALSACSSSAPYTLPAAVLNTGVALGAAGAQRAAGGCYATCTNGTLCNPRTGLCEAETAQLYCEPDPAGGTRCVPLTFPVVERAQEAQGGAAPPVGLSPATGEVPPPPGEASPRGP